MGVFIMKILFKFLEFVTKLQYLAQPSYVKDEIRLQKMLLWSARVYYFYSGLLFIFIKSADYFNISVHYSVFTALFALQAAILFYTLQTYRRFFFVSVRLKRNFALKLSFFLWLLIFFLMSIEQIIGYPIFSGSILILIARGGGIFWGKLLTNGFFWGFFFAVMGVIGEFLLRKINNNKL